MSDEQRIDLTRRVDPPIDPYDAGPLPGAPMSMEALNQDRAAEFCHGKKRGRRRYGGHQFGENGVCKLCPVTVDEFKRAGGIVLFMP